MTLGKRLTKVADLILPAQTLADVGCDHGYLSVYLVEHRICQHVIAMDINKGPLEKAKENIQKFHYGDYIETRLSDGLKELKSKEADGCVCAGMGGPLALEILWNDREKVKEMQQIVLQPQSELWFVRRTLRKWGFLIEREEMEWEDGKYYFMMRIRPETNLCMDVMPQVGGIFEDENHTCIESTMTDEMMQGYAYELFGKELLDRKDALLKEYICKEEKRLSDVYETLLLQKDSAKCRDRMLTIQKELAIHRWALGQYEVG